MSVRSWLCTNAPEARDNLQAVIPGNIRSVLVDEEIQGVAATLLLDWRGSQFELRYIKAVQIINTQIFV